MMPIFYYIKKIAISHYFLSLFALSVLAVLVIYFPSLSVGYLSDDWNYAYLSQHTAPAQSVSFLWSPDALGSGRGNFRPLPSILSVLVWKPLYGHPGALHLILLFLHSLIAAMTGVFVYKLWKNKGAAVISAITFAIHPLNTETAVWLSAWNAPLSVLPLLLGLILYTDKPKKFLGIGFLTAISLMSKEYGLLMPLFILGIDVLLKRKFAIATYAYLVLVDIFYVIWRLAVLGKVGGYVTNSGSSVHTLLSWHNVFEYIKLPLEYAYNFFNRAAAPLTLTYIAHILPVLVAGICVFYLWRARRQDTAAPILVLVLLVYAGNLLGWNLVNPLDLYTEHSRILYVSTLWTCVLLGFVWSVCTQKIARVSIVVYILFLFVLAHYQVQPWIGAGRETVLINAKILDNLKNIQAPSRIVIHNLPDSYLGAYIYRNGIEFFVALASHTVKGEILVEKSMQESTTKPIEIFIK